MVVPVFLLLLFGVIDFSRLIFSYISLTNGARELARSLTITSTSASTSAAAFNNLTTIAGGTEAATSVTVTISVGGVSRSITCSRTNALLCSIGLTDSSGTVTLTNLTSGGSTSFSTTGTNYALSATGNGDFIVQSWVAPDGYGQPQGYIQVCQLPLTSACSLPSFATATPRGWFTNGFLQVDLTYTFQFNPLFQNRLAGVVDVSFMRPTSLVTTSVRTYAE